MRVRVLDKLSHAARYGEEAEVAIVLGKIYTVIGVECNSLRILNEYCDPVLYDPEMFTVLDSAIPEGWITKVDPGGYVYANPKEFSAVGFYDKFHNGGLREVEVFREYVVKNNIISDEEWFAKVQESPWFWAKEYVRACKEGRVSKSGV